MNAAKNLHDVTATLFFILAFGYLFAALSLRNGYNASFMIFMMRLLDIPFAFIALLYGGSGLYLQLNEGAEQDDEEESAWNVALFAVCLLCFSAVVFVNFAFPSVI